MCKDVSKLMLALCFGYHPEPPRTFYSESWSPAVCWLVDRVVSGLRQLGRIFPCGMQPFSHSLSTLCDSKETTENAGCPPLFPLFVVTVCSSTLWEEFIVSRFYDVTLLKQLARPGYSALQWAYLNQEMESWLRQVFLHFSASSSHEQSII